MPAIMLRRPLAGIVALSALMPLLQLLSTPLLLTPLETTPLALTPWLNTTPIWHMPITLMR
ncbi:hypothetical protein HSBAA_12890 [Vreelandella sulfidaeris]|uniref:Uncharacterized protein n=1 Tax=Vreelandella sulfidaeris TaxID=115553 RepID=A0A455U466_9GAMM|nr:hypothetical protein HSBAA_12890 [Halomonas sulfidaeris]